MRTKHIISLTAAAALILSLGACNTTPKGDETTSADPTPSGEQTSPTDGAPTDPATTPQPEGIAGPDITLPDGYPVRTQARYGPTEKREPTGWNVTELNPPQKLVYASINCDGSFATVSQVDGEFHFSFAVLESEPDTTTVPALEYDKAFTADGKGYIYRWSEDSWELIQVDGGGSRTLTGSALLDNNNDATADFEHGIERPVVSNGRIWIQGRSKSMPNLAIVAAFDLQRKEFKVVAEKAVMLGKSDNGVVIARQDDTMLSAASGAQVIEELTPFNQVHILSVEPNRHEDGGHLLYPIFGAQSGNTVVLERVLGQAGDPQMIVVSDGQARLLPMEGGADSPQLSHPWLAWSEGAAEVGTPLRQYLYHVTDGITYDLGRATDTLGLPAVCGNWLMYPNAETGGLNIAQLP